MIDSPYDAVIVLGGGVDEQGRLNTIQRQRLDDAIKLQATGQAAVIILSGAYSYKAEQPPAMTEAAAMRNYVISQGVPTDKVFIEDQSKDTLGNVYFCKTTLLMPHGWHRIYVVSSAGHLEERLHYICNKVLGPKYAVHIVKFADNTNQSNAEREQRSFSLLQAWLDDVEAGDHEAVMNIMRQKHPGYGEHAEFSAEQLNHLIG